MNPSTERLTAIRLTRRFHAPPRRVFDAWLDPGLASRWLFATALRPMTNVEIEARVGGRFRLADRRIRNRDVAVARPWPWPDRRNGEVTEYTGEYLEIVPPRRLVFTLQERRRATRVTVEINRRKRGCELRLRHENVPLDCAHDTETRWSGMLYGLGETLKA